MRDIELIKVGYCLEFLFTFYLLPLLDIVCTFEEYWNPVLESIMLLALGNACFLCPLLAITLLGL